MSDMETSNPKIIEAVAIDDKAMDTIIKNVEESVENLSKTEATVSEEPPSHMVNSLYISEASDCSEQEDLIAKIRQDIGESPVTEKATENDAVVKEETSEEAVPSNTEAADTPLPSEEEEGDEEEEEGDEEEEEAEEEEEEEEEEEVEEEEEGEEGDEEEEEEDEEEEEEEEEEENENKVRYIHAIVIKKKNDEFPWPITCAATLLMFVYGLKLFFILCAMTGGNCSGRCVCLA